MPHPPVPPETVSPEATQTYYDAIYRGEPVRALRFSQSTSIDGVTGLFTFTVWQQTAVRDGFVRTRTGPVFFIIASMIGALALLVWFGVARGLAPLTDLESAIERRSSTDLAPIKRRIPQEVTGIVGRFNDLLAELSRTLDAKDAFISDAAHQLRNPIAGVMSLADSVANAKTYDDAITRSEDLRDAARDAGQLANNLLTLERARAAPTEAQVQTFDPVVLLDHIGAAFSESAKAKSIAFAAEVTDQPVRLSGDPVMFEQAILNVLNNALSHGGAGLSRVDMVARVSAPNFTVDISDDGTGIAPKDFERALGRFSQIGPSAGSGLGLPIAQAVLESFGGEISLSQAQLGLRVTMIFPLTVSPQPL